MRIRGEHVSAAPYRLDVAGILRIRLKLAAQAAHMVVDAAVEQLGVSPFGEIEQLVAGE